MNKTVNIENKFLLTFTEASQYFNIGENKLRNMASLEQNPDWIVYNGYRRLIKRVRLEEILLKSRQSKIYELSFVCGIISYMARLFSY